MIDKTIIIKGPIDDRTKHMIKHNWPVDLTASMKANKEIGDAIRKDVEGDPEKYKRLIEGTWDVVPGQHMVDAMRYASTFKPQRRTNMFKRLAFRMARGYILSKLEDPEFKAYIVKFINSKINIPRLNEKQERNLFVAIVNSCCEYFKVVK